MKPYKCLRLVQDVVCTSLCQNFKRLVISLSQMILLRCRSLMLQLIISKDMRLINSWAVYLLEYLLGWKTILTSGKHSLSISRLNHNCRWLNTSNNKQQPICLNINNYNEEVKAQWSNFQGKNTFNSHFNILRTSFLIKHFNKQLIIPNMVLFRIKECIHRQIWALLSQTYLEYINNHQIDNLWRMVILANKCRWDRHQGVMYQDLPLQHNPTKSPVQVKAHCHPSTWEDKLVRDRSTFHIQMDRQTLTTLKDSAHPIDLSSPQLIQI